MEVITMMRVFAAVARRGSFTAAAASMSLPRSSVSTAVRDLEAHLGARLLNRTTRQVSLTADGALYLEKCRQLLAELDDMREMFRPAAAISGGLRIDAPTRIGRLVIAPALPAFLTRHPALDLYLTVADRQIDLARDGVDCAIRVGDLKDSRLGARRLCEVDMLTCASPAYLERHGAPRSVRDLSGHYAINYAASPERHASKFDFQTEDGVMKIAMRARVSVNNAETYIACAEAGLGVIQVPAYDVEEQLASGALIEILPEARPVPEPLSLVFPQPGKQSARLRAFIEWATPLLRGRLSSKK